MEPLHQGDILKIEKIKHPAWIYPFAVIKK